ncbi:molybdenum cofactor guanylyltransferase MobA [Methylocystis bryophila]|uniref:Molybdenum cofactor guanylyltransferase n=1 Tax=Methylocystis bryophila TaxID=655015 RepID=A0A1W6MZ24_9HYPH|nr:molybdenum cofactor guanylyltransferase MobA [Methylocystis bryophila]ARN82799.1 molybdenum cofactor guanylyltransferase MobA [Methylocystis bryophila]BDV39045.1 molybdenum cofactor guanylyltransferase [Methylocystis bryophila]
MTKPVGLILAGGLARRLGGGDKGLIEIGGRPILARLIERLGPQCAALFLNANGDASRFARFGLSVIADEREEFAGPLAGVLAGMEHAASHFPSTCDLLSVPADTPFIPNDLAARLIEARADAGARIAVAASAGRAHHAVALWPVSLAGDLRQALADGERRVSGFIARYENVAAQWPTTPYDPFFNVNRPEDLAEAEALAREADVLFQ